LEDNAPMGENEIISWGQLLSQSSTWTGLITLTLLEIVLGVDNIVFITILAGKLPAAEQAKARNTGLILAVIPRLLLLLAIGFIVRMTAPLFTIPALPGIPSHGISVKDLVLMVGGLFLIWKSVKEIHHKLEENGHESVNVTDVVTTFSGTMVQILILNIVFSLDSVITAIGMVRAIEVMIAAVLVSTLFMLGFAKPVGEFVEKHPTVKMLALSFLILIGTNLLADGFGYHIPKGYTYFAMAFAVIVEMLNLRLRKRMVPGGAH
jgi:predicted tellurium resistance membrane protein TerC